MGNPLLVGLSGSEALAVVTIDDFVRPSDAAVPA